MNYYEILGVFKDASPEDLKKAYRKKASQHHPDREGGDTAKFQEVQKAYDVLSDPDSRLHYDQYGRDPELKTMESRAKSLVFELFMETIPGVIDLKTTNVVGKVHEKLRDRLNKVAFQHPHVRDAKMLKEVIRRMGDNFVTQALKDLRKTNAQHYLKLRKERQLIKKAIELLEGWDYRVDQRTTQDTYPRHRSFEDYLMKHIYEGRI